MFKVRNLKSILVFILLLHWTLSPLDIVVPGQRRPGLCRGVINATAEEKIFWMITEI